MFILFVILSVIRKGYKGLDLGLGYSILIVLNIGMKRIKILQNL